MTRRVLERGDRHGEQVAESLLLSFSAPTSVNLPGSLLVGGRQRMPGASSPCRGVGKGSQLTYANLNLAHRCEGGQLVFTEQELRSDTGQARVKRETEPFACSELRRSLFEETMSSAGDDHRFGRTLTSRTRTPLTAGPARRGSESAAVLLAMQCLADRLRHDHRVRELEQFQRGRG